ncbi:hypothetical protein AB0D11_47195 [Streptomyces monashensis]|uniref:hypothetical protein n=1 Tax=Streptomyces monashensis TaxID=1678012 RepID=UPI0033CEA4E3
MDELIDPTHDMPEAYEPRLPLLTLTEAHELLDVLTHFAATDHDWGAQARYFAAELAARIPSRDT